MSDDHKEKDPDLTDEEIEIVNSLKPEEIEEIDKVLLENSTRNWRKVAMVVGMAMSKLPQRVPEIPDLYYSQRVKELVKEGCLESQGNLSFMRFSEVRLPEGHSKET